MRSGAERQASGVGGITFVCSQVLPVNAATAGFRHLILILGVAAIWGLSEAATASVVAMLCYWGVPKSPPSLMPNDIRPSVGFLRRAVFP